MAITKQTVPLLHRKEWQMMTPAPTVTAAGSFVVHPGDTENLALLMSNATVHYLYHCDEDAWTQLPSGAIAGTFVAGACGARTRWSRTVTATGGSTTTITTTAAVNGLCIGRTVRMLSGTAANIGQERTITGAIINPGGTSTLQLSSALAGAVANADTFAVDTGRFFVIGTGTLAAGSFKEFDPLTMTWSSNLSITGLAATWGTDAEMIATPAGANSAYATGTATAGASTTITNSAKAWATNQWANYQVRITAGTGAGQIRTIASNTGTALTVSSAWGTNPDATSVYAIEANDDFVYLLGNNAVTLYRYSISGNTWSTLTPGVARAGAAAAGCSGNWIASSGDPNWANESDIRDGRYIYSFRGGATGALDRYDIPLNTWANITYGPFAETFTGGSSFVASGRSIFARKDATHRYMRYSARSNILEPVSTNLYPDGAAVVGDKVWITALPANPDVKWLYSLQNTGVALHRLMLI